MRALGYIFTIIILVFGFHLFSESQAPDVEPVLVKIIKVPGLADSYHWFDDLSFKNRVLIVSDVNPGNGSPQKVAKRAYRLPERETFLRWYRGVPKKQQATYGWTKSDELKTQNFYVDRNSGKPIHHPQLSYDQADHLIWNIAKFTPDITIETGGVALLVLSIPGLIIFLTFRQVKGRNSSEKDQYYLVPLAGLVVGGGIVLASADLYGEQYRYIEALLSKLEGALSGRWSVDQQMFIPIAGFPWDWVEDNSTYVLLNNTLGWSASGIFLLGWVGVLIYIAECIYRAPVAFYFLFVPHKMEKTIDRSTRRERSSKLDGKAIAKAMDQPMPSNPTERLVMLQKLENLTKEMRAEKEWLEAEAEAGRLAEEMEKARVRANEAQKRADAAKHRRNK